jgi:hypothetical protein
MRDGKPTTIHLRRVEGFTKKRLKCYAAASLADGASLVSDGLPCFAAVAEAGFAHTVTITGGGAGPTDLAFHVGNTVSGNVKATITGTCRGGAPRHTARYLAAYEYCFNRRTDLAS